MIMAVIMVLSLVVVIFITVFVIAHCCTMHNNTPYLATAAETLIFSSAVVPNTSDANYNFRVKNGLDYQNGLVM